MISLVVRDRCPVGELEPDDLEQVADFGRSDREHAGRPTHRRPDRMSAPCLVAPGSSDRLLPDLSPSNAARANVLCCVLL